MLEIEEDLAFQQRDWAVQRIGWAVMALIVVAAAAGLFGTGPLAATTVANDDGTLEVDYPRFARRGGSIDIVVRADATLVADGQLQIDFAEPLLAAMDVDSITPEPSDATVAGRALRYTFAVTEPAAVVEVAFALTPDAMGSVSGQVAAGGAAVPLSLFLYP